MHDEIVFCIFFFPWKGQSEDLELEAGAMSLEGFSRSRRQTFKGEKRGLFKIVNHQ